MHRHIHMVALQDWGAAPGGRRESDGHEVDNRWVRWKVGEMKLRPGRCAGAGGGSKNDIPKEKEEKGSRRNTPSHSRAQKRHAHVRVLEVLQQTVTPAALRAKVYVPVICLQARWNGGNGSLDRALPHYTDADDSRASDLHTNKSQSGKEEDDGVKMWRCDRINRTE
ncbi:hypothetical protein B0H13DRAFT_1866554 [Mycena leptocephala]|nr:hypothetical protein B0H13DRAFT_1866554 [Mycena leptocephala]